MERARDTVLSEPDYTATCILVVEDQDEARELLSDLLATAGFSVVTAENGIDAVDTAVKLLPELILMDLSLPLMGGCEAARLLKSDERTLEIPIIALTGHHNYAEMARSAGCDAFLTKPIAPEKLLEEIYRMLDVDPDEVRRSARSSSN